MVAAGPGRPAGAAPAAGRGGPWRAGPSAAAASPGARLCLSALKVTLVLMGPVLAYLCYNVMIAILTDWESARQVGAYNALTDRTSKHAGGRAILAGAGAAAAAAAADPCREGAVIATVLTHQDAPGLETGPYKLALVPAPWVGDMAVAVRACERIPNGTRLGALRGRRMDSLASFCRWRMAAYGAGPGDETTGAEGPAGRIVHLFAPSGGQQIFLDGAGDPSFENFVLRVKPPRPGAGESAALRPTSGAAAATEGLQMVLWAQRDIAAGEEVTAFWAGAAAREAGKCHRADTATRTADAAAAAAAAAGGDPCGGGRVAAVVLTHAGLGAGRTYRLGILPMPNLGTSFNPAMVGHDTSMAAAAAADGKRPAEHPSEREVPSVGVIACEDLPPNATIGLYAGRRLKDGPEYGAWLDFWYPRNRKPAYAGELDPSRGRAPRWRARLARWARVAAGLAPGGAGGGAGGGDDGGAGPGRRGLVDAAGVALVPNGLELLDGAVFPQWSNWPIRLNQDSEEEPNAEFAQRVLPDGSLVEVVVTKRWGVPAGQEVTVHYGTGYWAH